MSMKFRSFANRAFFVFLLFFCIVLPQTALAYKATDFKWIPPFLARDEKPSIIIILDNSGSMLGRAYSGTFDSQKEYYGYFDPRTYYTYSSTNHFQPNNATGKWNGNWLNWATMHRCDVARKVLGGGNYADGYYDIEKQDSSDRIDRFEYKNNIVVDLSNQSKKMTPLPDIIYIDHRTSSQNFNIYSSWSDSYPDKTYTMRVQGPQKNGVLHAFKDKSRMALFVYDNNQGARIQHYMSEDVTTLNSLINTVNTVDPTTWTPLAESLFTVYGYIMQSSTGGDYGPRYLYDTSYKTSTTNDPYYFPALGKKVHCTKQNVILITDGESTQDTYIPSTFSGEKIAKRIVDPRIDYASYGTSYLVDVAHWGQTTDLRSDLEGFQNVDFYAVFAFGKGSTLLRDAARYGRFLDSNDNDLPDLQKEYDVDEDGIPDNYFEAESGQELEASITQAFQLATASIASGTAAAVTSQTRSGEGAIYQSLFFPPTESEQIAPHWSGQVHAYLLDALGNMREDTNGNKKLDPDTDKVIQFDGELIYAHTDANGDSVISEDEKNATSLASVNDINFLWSTSDWLNTLTDGQAISQRISYETVASNRYIFTFVDKNKDMIADNATGEIQNFVLNSAPTDLNSTEYFHNYLTLYEADSGKIDLALGSPINILRTNDPAAFATLQGTLAQRQVEFIRGKDVGNATVSGITDTVRSRTLNGKPWRLGDIIYSSPTIVDKPAENYHLIYQDKTYEGFYKKYTHRRQMVYTGANDGMLHAFNGGFYNRTQKTFLTSLNGESAFPLGMELWAYVPYNLLPHLKWLMNPEYGEKLHVAYMDLKPRVFDARVFFESDGITPSNNATHPDGWGTILVAGMRLGGAKIEVDIDKADGNAFNSNIDRTLTSAYVIMDITNPEQAPTLLGEITMPGQGFTTCYPTVMPMTERNAKTATANQWYLVFGSGPAIANGEASGQKLEVETSDQSGNLYILDLKALVAEKTIKSVTSDGSLVTGGATFANTEAGSFVSDPIAVDLNIGLTATPEEFKTDTIYFGTVAGDQTEGQGKIYRLLTNNDNQAPMSWSLSPLIDVGQPITAAPSAATDEDNRLWIYFGTGRFFNRDDIPQAAHMSFYGVKEPVDANGTNTWATVSVSDLFNSTEISLNNSTCGGQNDSNCVIVYQGQSELGSWQTLLDTVDATPGWRQDFSPARERVLGQAAVLGGATIFTTYLPSEDICSFEGTSNLWALYYKTGTAFFRPILGATDDTINTYAPLGKGMAITPNLHVGERGATTFVQSSTGAIVGVQSPTPLPVRSGVLFWQRR